MQLRADIQLRAAIKALVDTVAPAIDAQNKLAVEQLQMVVGALTFVEEHLPLQFRFDCDELNRLLDLAASLDDSLGREDQGLLEGVRRASEAGSRVLERAKADPSEVLNAVRDLRIECGAVTTAFIRQSNPALRNAVSANILAYSKLQTLRDRSWLQSLGFESPDAGIPPIAELLGDNAAHAEASSPQAAVIP